MAVELSFVLITPYSLMKSRTGGILARLLSRTDLDLVGAQMLAPTHEFVQIYARSVQRFTGERDDFSAKLFSDYLLDNFSPLPNGTAERVLMLLFRGENACEKIASLVGALPNAKNRRTPVYGETIRDTYADLVFNRDGSLNYFEPAVFTPPDSESCIARLGYLADFAGHSSNLVDHVVGQQQNRERTMVIIKPDNWRCPSTRPGNIIDIFSKTGLQIIGCKIYQMSVADALKFYEPVKESMRKKIAPKIGRECMEKLSEMYNLKMRPESEQLLIQSIGQDFADDKFSRLVEFMSGCRPENCPESELNAPGKVKCMILIYEGPDAVKKIRDVLGPTDPNEAPSGTIRREFGHDIMANTAQASSSRSSFQRESKIVRIDENSLADEIRSYLKTLKR